MHKLAVEVFLIKAQRVLIESKLEMFSVKLSILQGECQVAILLNSMLFVSIFSLQLT